MSKAKLNWSQFVIFVFCQVSKKYFLKFEIATEQKKKLFSSLLSKEIFSFNCCKTRKTAESAIFLLHPKKALKFLIKNQMYSSESSFIVCTTFGINVHSNWQLALCTKLTEFLHHHGLVVKADGSQSRGCRFEPRRGKLDGCYVDCFTSITLLRPLNDMLTTADDSRR